MADKRDYYEVLGVGRNADDTQIKRHIVSWQNNITRTPMQVTQMLRKSLRKSQKHITS